MKFNGDLSLDLDNKWSYLRTHDDSRWTSYPGYLPYVVPKVLEILRSQQLTITFFVIGKDAESDANREVLGSIVAAGHEIGNHSFNHQPWLQRYTQEQLIEEFDRSEAALASFCETRPVGFRAPGYSLSADVLELLCERGYRYDASTLPTYLGPAARTYYLLKGSFSKAQREDRKQLFGEFADGFRSLKPYMWSTPKGEMLELPVSTIPVVRTPFHFSYLHYLAQFSEWMAKSYFLTALRMCRLRRVEPSLLLHPLDFLGAEEVPELSFFPGMKIAGSKKRDFVKWALERYCDMFEITSQVARAERLLLGSNRLRRVSKLPYRD